MAWEAPSRWGSAQVQFDATPAGIHTDMLADNLDKLSRCIRQGGLSKPTCRHITDRLNQLARDLDELASLPFPTRREFFAALQKFHLDHDVDALRGLDPLGRQFPICLFHDDNNGFAVILLVTFRAPTWVSSTVRLVDGESVAAYREARCGAFFSVAGGVPSPGVDLGRSAVCHDTAEAVEGTALAQSFPLGQLYVLPKSRWEVEANKHTNEFRLPESCRTNFYALLHTDGNYTRGWGQANIWAAYNYYPNRPIEGGIRFSMNPIGWNKNDFLLTLLRNESELTAQMAVAGIINKHNKFRFMFDLLPLLPISGEVVGFESLRQFAMSGAHMLHPRLKPYTPSWPETPVSTARREPWSGAPRKQELQDETGSAPNSLSRASSQSRGSIPLDAGNWSVDDRFTASSWARYSCIGRRGERSYKSHSYKDSSEVRMERGMHTPTPVARHGRPAPPGWANLPPYTNSHPEATKLAESPEADVSAEKEPKLFGSIDICQPARGSRHAPRSTIACFGPDVASPSHSENGSDGNRTPVYTLETSSFSDLGSLSIAW